MLLLLLLCLDCSLAVLLQLNKLLVLLRLFCVAHKISCEKWREYICEWDKGEGNRARAQITSCCHAHQHTSNEHHRPSRCVLWKSFLWIWKIDFGRDCEIACACVTCIILRSCVQIHCGVSVCAVCVLRVLFEYICCFLLLLSDWMLGFDGKINWILIKNVVSSNEMRWFFSKHTQQAMYILYSVKCGKTNVKRCSFGLAYEVVAPMWIIRMKLCVWTKIHAKGYGTGLWI